MALVLLGLVLLLLLLLSSIILGTSLPHPTLVTLGHCPQVLTPSRLPDPHYLPQSLLPSLHAHEP